MHLFSRLRRCRGLTAPFLLLLAAGGVPHHHADHDGNLVHVDEEHGSHGTVTAAVSDLLPAVGLSALPAAMLVGVAPANFAGLAAGTLTPADSAPRRFGHDPPQIHGSRAPPPLLL